MRGREAGAGSGDSGSRPAPPGRSVLIVEDDPGVAELIQERLAELGCECRVAADGKRALEEIGRMKPELLVLDYSLPDMRADELLATAGPIPFMIATGRGDEELAVRFMRAGARDYLIKDGGFLDEVSVVAARVLRELDTERRLAEATMDLEERLGENEAMLREIHHRVKNNLQIISSLVRLQTPAEARPEVKEIFASVQSRIWAMALVHETLYESDNLGRVDFLSYLESLAKSLDLAMAPPGLDLEIGCSGDRLQLPIDRAVPLGLIANELITNAIKHAYGPEWRGPAPVSAATAELPDGRAELRISDRGAGFCREEAERLASGRDRGQLGLHLVKALAGQIDAEIDCSQEPGGGTAWTVTFCTAPRQAGLPPEGAPR